MKGIIEFMLRGNMVQQKIVIKVRPTLAFLTVFDVSKITSTKVEEILLMSLTAEKLK